MKKVVSLKLATNQVGCQVEPHGTEASWSLGQLKALKRAAAGYRADEAMSKVRSLMEYFRVRNFFEGEASAALQVEEDARLFLFRLNVSAKIIKADGKYIRFRAPTLLNVPRLPTGYGFKGGVARLALEAILGRAVRGVVPRDLDIVRFGTSPSRRDTRLAQKYMPEDARYGYGVELIAGLDEYMDSRDLTINQVLFMGSQVICSLQGLKDTLAGVLRPCAHIHSGKCAGRILAKMLRLKAEASVRGQTIKLEDAPPARTASRFDVGMHLARALSCSREVAQAYIQECRAQGLIDAGSDDELSLERVIANLKEEVPNLIPRMQVENQDGYISRRLVMGRR